MPSDILLLLLDALDTEGLRNTSSLNHTIYRLVNTRLWRKVTLSDSGPPLYGSNGGRKRRSVVAAGCYAVLRDLERAGHIRTLVIRASRPLGRWDVLAHRTLQRVCNVLKATRNITHFEIAFCSGVSRGSRDDEAFARLLARNASAFSFRLTTLVCNYRMDEFIEPFLRRQSSLVEYNMCEDSGLLSEEPEFEADDVVAARRANILPLLTRIQGPPTCVRKWLSGRTLDTVNMKSYETERAFTFLQNNFGASKETSDKPLCTAHKFAMCLWASDSSDYRLPDLIRVSYATALDAISVLRIESYRPPNAEVIPKVLERFPSLQNFRWDGQYRTVFGDDLDAEWIDHFVRDCSKYAPLLRKISLTEHSGSRRTFKRISRTSLARRERRGEVVPHVVGHGGFVWTSETQSAVNDEKLPLDMLEIVAGLAHTSLVSI